MRSPTPTPCHAERTPALARGGRLAPSLPALVVAVVCAMSAIGCGSPDPLPVERAAQDPATQVRVPAPTVREDLASVKQRGTLRVLLRNSSSSYYFLRGEEYGFEFELARAVAEELGLRLQIVLPDSARSPVDALNLGQVDLVAIPHRANALPPADVAMTRAYDSGQQMLVTRADPSTFLRDADDLSGQMVAVRRFSAGESRLFDLRRDGVPVGIVMHAPATSIEELLDLVADGTYPATVATDRELASVMRFRPNLVEAFPLGERTALHWLVRSNAPELQAAIDHVLAQHYRPREDGTHAGSEFYNVVRGRYFADDAVVHRHAVDPFRLSRTGRLSPYDDLFKATADSFDLDWRLLASMAFQESRFDPEAESWAGAVGIMQVMPATAGLPEDALRDPPTNVDVGARHLRWLLERYDYVPRGDRVRFALAAYNCGHGHLDDARMLSVRRGLDPNAWEGSVRESLLLLRKPKYHRDARFGYVRGHETVGYVREVLHRYEVLSRLTDLGPRPQVSQASAAGAAASSR